jgi:hypothetical protein
VRDGQTSPHRPRFVVSRSTCPPLSPSPHANSVIIGTAVLNTHSNKTTTHANSFIIGTAVINKHTQSGRHCFRGSLPARGRGAAAPQAIQGGRDTIQGDMLWLRRREPPIFANSCRSTPEIPARRVRKEKGVGEGGGWMFLKSRVGRRCRCDNSPPAGK